jgi:hypothetical protein
MAKKADDESSPIKVQRKVEPVFKLPPPPAWLFSRPSHSPRLAEEIERQRRQVEELRRLEERWPKPDPAEAARLVEERRAFDRDMAIRDGLIEPPWLKRLVERLTQPAPPVVAPSPPKPKTDAPTVDDSPGSCIDDAQAPQKDERQSRQRTRYAGAKSNRALAVLGRMYQDHVYPTRSEVPDSVLWELFVKEWARVEGARGLSLNLRPSQSTVLRIIGRKD